MNRVFAEKLEESLKACIHCGMCLPACPTYNATMNEANSPRGRIYLINDLVKEHDGVEEKNAVEYLDNCLSCFACETVCPSNVEYGNILHHAREELGYSNYHKGLLGFMRKLFFSIFINSRFLLRVLRLKLKFFGFLIKPAMALLGFSQQIKLMPKLDTDYKSIEEGEIYYSDLEIEVPHEKRIINFSLGCVMDTVYNNVHRDTIFVLNAFGFHVNISKSKCCGSLAAHSGEFKLGEKLKKQFCQTVKDEGLPLVTNSAGCGAFLKESEQSVGVYDFIEVLKKASFNPLADKKFNGEIIYHPACHINHRQGVSDDYEKLLSSVEGLKVHTLDQKDTCCGSAGFYNLIQADMAQKVADLKIAEIKESQIKTLVTANPGCMGQIQSNLPADYAIMHPATFLKRVLEQ
jgi:glycolate oxidase iron-sulfur subunit